MRARLRQGRAGQADAGSDDGARRSEDKQQRSRCEGSGYGLNWMNCDGLIVPVALCWTLLNVPERRLYRYLSTVNHSVSRGVLPHERLVSAL